MGIQLELFKHGGHYFFSVDGKRDFVAYNVDAYRMTEEDIKPEDIREVSVKKTDTLHRLFSEAWSSNCKFFFVLQDEGIYLFSVHQDSVWLCRKHSHKFVQMYLNPESFNSGTISPK